LNDSGGVIVREYARHKETWNKYKEVPYDISEAFYRDLIDISIINDETKIAIKERKFNSSIDASVNVFNMGYAYWMKVYDKVKDERILNFSDKMFVKSMAEIVQKNILPTSSQSKKLIKIFNSAEDAGIVFD
jgi:hypothetical protein